MLRFMSANMKLWGLTAELPKSEVPSYLSLGLTFKIFGITDTWFLTAFRKKSYLILGKEFNYYKLSTAGLPAAVIFDSSVI